MHKRRKKNNLKYSFLKYGTTGLKFNHEGQFEIKHLFMMKRMLRKRFKKKRFKKRVWVSKQKKVWLFLFPNFIISKKSKNSRMGKGKGNIERWTIRVRCGLIFLEFKSIHLQRVLFFRNSFQKRVRILIDVVFSKKSYSNVGPYFYSNKMLSSGIIFL